GGMMGWVPVPMVVSSDEDAGILTEKIESMKNHPALAIWEAPDEAVWNVFRLEDGIVTTRPWSKPPETRGILERRMDDLVGGLRRGTEIIRELDPGRRTWLNEACKTNQDALARCISFFDVVSFDFYPIPQGHPRYDWDGYAIHHIGKYTEKFARTVGSREVWVVQQAFSWPSIMPETGRPYRYPSRKEFRFMAWDAIVHGATGLLWFGSAYEDRPAPFLDDLMAVVSELNCLQPFLLSGNAPGLDIRPDPDQHPAVAGVAGIVRRVGDKSLLVIVNDDSYDHDVIISGIEFDPEEIESLVPDREFEFTEAPGGWITNLGGWEAGVYLV
ncbi:MAG: hypothetical protein HXS50_02590, partial [Theionarchaea archaeon]|nr:hypothetical protein [Theionarchaea archaeon]